MIGTIFIFAVVIIAFLIYLPYSSGLATYKYEKKPSERAQQKNKDEYLNNYQGYIPPDEEAALRKQGQDSHSFKVSVSKLKEKAHVTSSDIPLKFKLQQDSTLRKRNKEKLDINNDPNKFDYDIDELIREENESAMEDQKREFYKNLQMGKEKEAMV
ncbi:uncharacterized protein AC631_02829 [Debaryomyces fabryi]|uniref:Uncharacterized protein n=1 Tax=Debaryomyces fabryi TaxID=58627 RepID=A0A0V1PYU5_9ASCO|nr:uncharacterized protein AC631_02829 [Debaryomyces fabryi]KSA01401.1 hypothetical protein AC631_02829 [Debaryomyces fabryi]CUM52839.1 unnamed protein product [Debaryomyces fabryi]